MSNQSPDRLLQDPMDAAALQLKNDEGYLVSIEEDLASLGCLPS